MPEHSQIHSVSKAISLYVMYGVNAVEFAQVLYKTYLYFAIDLYICILKNNIYICIYTLPKDARVHFETDMPLVSC